MTVRPDIAAWLGDTATDITDEQADRLAELFDTITTRWAGEDLDDVRRETLSGATQIVLGDDTLEGLGEVLARARQAERDAMAALTGALLASASGERYGPGTESALAARAGVQRATVRKALGK